MLEHISKPPGVNLDKVSIHTAKNLKTYLESLERERQAILFPALYSLALNCFGIKWNMNGSLSIPLYLTNWNKH
jgi:hypothetical protein